MSGSIRFPTYLPTVSDRGGRQQRGGEQREVAQRRGRTTEEAGKIHLFIPALSVKSPVQFLFLCLLLSCFLLLYPARLSLCPSLTQTSNPSPFTPHSFLNPKSLLPSLPARFSIVLPVPLCYPPPPSSPFCLSHLNMPPLSITLLHTPDDCSTPYFLSFILNLFFSFFLPPLFSLLSSTYPLFATTSLPSLSFHYAACSPL